jgi:hypothetical protein
MLYSIAPKVLIVQEGGKIMEKEIKIARNVFEGYLTVECPTCECWKDGSNMKEGLGCAYPGPIDHCQAFRKQFETDQKA